MFGRKEAKYTCYKGMERGGALKQLKQHNEKDLRVLEKGLLKQLLAECEGYGEERKKLRGG